HLDLYLGNYFQDGARILDVHAAGSEDMHEAKSKAFNGGRDHLFLWQWGQGGADPEVGCVEAAGAVDEAISRQWTLGVGAIDLDGDLLPELYLANDFGPDQLLRNVTTRPGQPRFVALRGHGSFATP